MNYLDIGEGGNEEEEEEESAEGDTKAAASIAAVDDEQDASESSGDELIDFSHITLDDPTTSSDNENSEESLEQQETSKPSGRADAEVVDLVDSSDDDGPIVMTESKKLAPRLLASKPSPALAKARRRIVIESSSSEEEEEWDGRDELNDTESFEEQQQQEEQDVWLIDDSSSEESNNTAEENQANNKPWMDKVASFLPNLTQKKAAQPKGLSKAAFRQQRETLTESFFAEFNQKAFDGKLSAVEISWSNKMRTTAGLTRLKRTTTNQGVKLSATIELSTKVIDEERRLRSTLLHEMCHAAAWLIDSVSKPPHGKCFQKWANTAMRRVPNIVVTTRHEYEISYKFAWACTTPKCGAVIKRHSRSVDVVKQCCGRCKGKLIEIEVPGENGSSVTERTPRKKAPLSEYNRFVKQHSKQVKDELVKERVRQGLPLKVSQPDVLKELGRRWKEHKQGASSANEN
jgi:predicted SprT family Zn-dependent metalloprotease